MIRVRSCGPEQAAKRLHDATAFLEIAEIAGDSDVKATNAIHSAIAAADTICCLALRRRSAGQDHLAAVDLLAEVDSKLANDLRRSLQRKIQAGYEDRDVSDADADRCVTYAMRLATAARERFLQQPGTAAERGIRSPRFERKSHRTKLSKSNGAVVTRLCPALGQTRW